MNGLITGKIEITYINEFGDTTEFRSTLSGVNDVYKMQECFCRFLLAAGWGWENVKEFHPEYMDESRK